MAVLPSIDPIEILYAHRPAVERSVGVRARREPEPAARFVDERFDGGIDGLETFECGRDASVHHRLAALALARDLLDSDHVDTGESFAMSVL
jgi:hypothetical protein